MQVSGTQERSCGARTVSGRTQDTHRRAKACYPSFATEHMYALLAVQFSGATLKCWLLQFVMYVSDTYMYCMQRTYIYTYMCVCCTVSAPCMLGLCRMIDCIHCCRTLHKVCALWHESIWPEGYQCDSCLTALGTLRKDNKFAAKSKWSRLEWHTVA